MKLTKAELEKINTMPDLVELCKLAIKVNERGLKKKLCFEFLEGLIRVFKKCPLVKILDQREEQPQNNTGQ